MDRRWLLLPLLGAGAGAGAGAVVLLRTRRGDAQPPVEKAPGHPRLVRPSGSLQGTVLRSAAHGRGREDELPLYVGRYVLGRSMRADLRLMDTTVSPVHAELVVHADGVVLLRDLETEYGVRVDGQPVWEAELVDGNRVELGATVLVFKTDLMSRAEGRNKSELS